jgi:hypothetical protein
MSAIEFQNGCISGFFEIFRFFSLSVSYQSSLRFTVEAGDAGIGAAASFGSGGVCEAKIVA